MNPCRARLSPQVRADHLARFARLSDRGVLRHRQQNEEERLRYRHVSTEGIPSSRPKEQRFLSLRVPRKLCPVLCPSQNTNDAKR
jgi:hypothetical protein